MSDTETLATWTESPYTSYDKRHITVKHRVRVIRYEGGFADVIHQRQVQDDASAVEWEEVKRTELRDHGMRTQKVRDGLLEE